MNSLTITLTNYSFTVPAGKNIIVLSNYRTGPTAFCDMLRRRTGFYNYGEAFAKTGYPLGKRIGILAEGQQKIVKIQPNHVPEPQYWDEVFNNGFLIGLTRENFVAQVLSYMIAEKTNIWSQTTDKMVLFDSNDITDEYICKTAEWLAERCLEYTKCRPLLDVELCYEKISMDLEQSAYRIHPKFNEYNEILTRIDTLLNKKYNE
jgi:hypothetical protein